ncbi:transposase [Streptomyces morookaense]|uniref:Transposase n=1 Tax=Streptomyces morookaense TaxID=1970 RepID=A0A7Y7E915_STRMO|nr:transposase [Streptomyces morookaense]NVK80024.1 transposase [Streptomyces morookaense]GHF41564.1 hypothetical protein GCM10010359_50280 [Streptomyces morookaense]
MPKYLHVKCNPVNVRAAVHRFEKGGLAALPDAARPGRPAKILGPDDRAALAEMLDASDEVGITWIVPALRDWLGAQRGVEISAYWLWELLRRDGFRWKRSRNSVRHQADPRPPADCLGPAGGLAALRQDTDTGKRDLIFLDESGFAPTMPTGENRAAGGGAPGGHQNRRVNVLGAQIAGTAPDLLWQRACGKFDGTVLLDFVCMWIAGLRGRVGALELSADGLGIEAIPACERAPPCTVVLDNASAHTSRVFKGQRGQLVKIGVELSYLPPHSPELNDIELVWRQAKYQDYP